MRGSASRRALVVVAHPDDELIFFGATIRSLTGAGWSVDVVCVTGQFGDPRQTSVRRAELSRSCWALGARARQLSLVDVPGELDEEELHTALAGLLEWPSYQRILTHGVWGEYGHPHHIQVSRAVHRLAPTVTCLAGPFPPRTRHRLSSAEFWEKQTLAVSVYRSQPFAATWCTEREWYTRYTTETAILLTGIGLGSAERGPAPASTIRTLATLAVRLAGDTFPDVAHIPEQVWLLGHRERVRRLTHWAGVAMAEDGC
jgi:LmbE family N-acetylglucosaminyl deacetylase